MTTTSGTPFGSLAHRSHIRVFWPVVVGLVLMVCSPAGTATSGTKSVAKPVSTRGGVDIPTTTAGNRLNDVLAIARSGTVSNTRYIELFSDMFRSQISLADFQSVLDSAAGSSVRVEKVLVSTPTEVSVVATGVGGRFKIDLVTDSDKKISGLLLSPFRDGPAPTVPTRWADIDRRLKTLSPTHSMVAATIDSAGKCSVVHGVRESKAAPLGSMFKLYVLAAVADSVAARRLTWKQDVAVREEWKSLPSGKLQNEPAGTKRTVTEIANDMISISDNTATDHLIRTVGRGAVEKTMVATGIAIPDRNLPFLTTRELFVLKGANYPSLATRYRQANGQTKRSLLDGEIAKTRLTDVRPWTSPREVDTLEWFGSPMDICRAFAYLDARAAKPSGIGISEALSINDGGLALDSTKWPTVWFKGGSEPGVFALGYFAKRGTGERVAVVTLLSNPTKPFDELAAAEDLLALVRGAFGLAAAR